MCSWVSYLCCRCLSNSHMSKQRGVKACESITQRLHRNQPKLKIAMSIRHVHCSMLIAHAIQNFETYAYACTSRRTYHFHDHFNAIRARQPQHHWRLQLCTPAYPPPPHTAAVGLHRSTCGRLGGRLSGGPRDVTRRSAGSRCVTSECRRRRRRRRRRRSERRPLGGDRTEAATSTAASTGGLDGWRRRGLITGAVGRRHRRTPARAGTVTRLAGPATSGELKRHTAAAPDSPG